MDRLRPTSQQQSSDTKGLSGGEKSFTTVSLLLALWEAMESPFRAMDEFDVFMVRISIPLAIYRSIWQSINLYIPSHIFFFFPFV